MVGLVQLAGCLPEDDRCGELLSAFADLSADQVWLVRQDCASELAALAQQLPRAVVRDRLLPLWEALAGDVSAWVKAAARRQAGPLLASVHREDVTGGAGALGLPAGIGHDACLRLQHAGCGLPSLTPARLCSPASALLECFVSAAAGPATLTKACAHFMPAVLANVGADCWPQLRCAAPRQAFQQDRACPLRPCNPDHARSLTPTRRAPSLCVQGGGGSHGCLRVPQRARHAG